MGIGLRARGSSFGIGKTRVTTAWLRGATSILFGVSVLAMGGGAHGQSLTGSSGSLDRQNAQAAAHDFSYLESASRIRAFVEAGYLVRVAPNRDFDLHDVSYPYARPEARLFIERLASQYRAACGEKLVVTSLTRPQSAQPWNASDRSVHPTGMAIDIRSVNIGAACRRWLESTLLALERAGVLEATRERVVPHYHIALYPAPYAAYVDKLTSGDGRGPVVAAAPSELVATLAASGPAESADRAREHVVRRGDTLGSIAMLYGTSVAQIRRDNGLSGDGILVGQRLTVEWAGPAIPPRSASETVQHLVGRGESLWTIARLYGISESELRAMNGLSGSRILVGQTLEVPRTASSGGYLQHTVQGGDSLWTIAEQYGTSVAEIRRTNGIGGSRIFAGQVIRVPQAD